MSQHQPTDLRPHFDALAKIYPQYSRRHEYYHKVIGEWIAFCVPSNASLMDVGCGDGGLLERVKPRQGFGVDFSSGFLDLARKRCPNYTFYEVDITKESPSLSEKPDFITAVDVLAYVEDIQGLLERLRGMCGANTRVILTKVNPLWAPLLWLLSKMRIIHPRQYSSWLGRKQCAHIIALAGFEVIRDETFLLIPFYIPVISHVVNTYLARLPWIRRLGLVDGYICRPAPRVEEASPSVSVIIPCRNERGNVRAALERMPAFAGACEVIFVEGHSSDGTWEEIQNVVQEQKYPFSIKAFQQEGKGKGDAVRLGFDQASHDLLMILDADLTVMPEALPRFYEALRSGKAEYVQGTRLVYPMEETAMRPLNWLANKTFGLILTFLTGQYMSDTLCGTKCLSRTHYEAIKRNRTYFGEFDPFGDFDLIFGATKQLLKIEEIPIRYKGRTYGETQIRRFRDGWLLVKMCVFAARKLRFVGATSI